MPGEPRKGGGVSIDLEREKVGVCNYKKEGFGELNRCVWGGGGDLVKG